MKPAVWKEKTPHVPLDTVAVFHAGIEGMDVQLGNKVLGVQSQEHWEDINAKVMQCFASLPPRRCLPPRTDGMLANVAGDCYRGDE